MGINWGVDIVALILLIIGAVVAWVRMQQTVKSNKELSNAELSHIIKTIESLKTDFTATLENVKDDLKEHIEQANKSQSQTLADTKEELKEDISRLEKKQAESNCIKERLAKTEVWVDNFRQYMTLHKI